MKIQRLTIEGFRSLKNVEWQPGDLNILIGPNGSGKSNLLRFLELISASAKGKLSDYIQATGGIRANLWDGRVQHIEFGLIIDAEVIPDKYLYTVQLEYAPYLNHYIVENEDLTFDQSRSIKSLTNVTIKRHNGKIHTVSEVEVNVPISTADLSDEETLLSEFSGLAAHSIASGIRPDFARSMFKVNVPHFKTFLEDWTVYNDVLVHANTPMRQPIVTRMDKRIAPDGQNLISVLHTLYTSDRNFKQDVNSAMQAAFGDDFDELIFPPAADQRIQMRVRWKTLQREQSTADLSDGTLRFLFLLTVLANPEPPALIAIDEPETGLHPSMLPIIAEYAVEASRHSQVILSTHSAEFLDAFTDTRPTTTVFKWENGETSLNIIDDERLAYWLRNYTMGNLQRTGELEQMV